MVSTVKTMTKAASSLMFVPRRECSSAGIYPPVFALTLILPIECGCLRSGIGLFRKGGGRVGADTNRTSTGRPAEFRRFRSAGLVRWPADAQAANARKVAENAATIPTLGSTLSNP